MSSKTFIDAVVEAARTERPVMPWTRGARRAAMIDRRVPERIEAAAS
ncbi:hypothetical protein [Jannaschia sp. W003]|nr:hypothetical protein [Jannaschia sp. W003]UWQ22667.1 hypothetical protein K3554_06480 [Jannaschia sp. W003]